jgi:hypothetical protein
MILEMLPQKSQNQIICPPPNAVIARAAGAPIRRSVSPPSELQDRIDDYRSCQQYTSQRISMQALDAPISACE